VTADHPEGFFRCPHCKRKTITAWTKLKTRGECPACGGRFTAGSLGFLLASVAAPLGLFVPFFVLRPMSLPPVWAAVALGLLVSFALGVAVYLFTTPLWRKGSAVARWDYIAFVTLIAAALVAGLRYSDFSREAGLTDSIGEIRVGSPIFSRTGPDGVTHRVSHGDPRVQQALKEALDKAGIKYKVETRDGKEWIGWSDAQNAAVEKVQERTLESAYRQPPSLHGHNVRFTDAVTQQAFIDWLVKKGIKYRLEPIGGEEYVAWDGPDDLAMQFVRERPSKCDKVAAAPKTAAKRCG
jgi:hypothetical protein